MRVRVSFYNFPTDRVNESVITLYGLLRLLFNSDILRLVVTWLTRSLYTTKRQAKEFLAKSLAAHQVKVEALLSELIDFCKNL